MMPLYEMMRDAQNGAALRAYAQQFGLDESQVADAFAALTPAFSTGLKRNVAGPKPVADFLSALAEGHHRRYFENMQAAFSPAGTAEGNAILGHLFGSPELSRRIARQAADATGLAEATLKKMMPAMAATIMGGLYSQTMDRTGERSPAPDLASGNLIGDIMKEMIRYQAKGRTDLPERPAGGGDPFTQMMEMFGPGAMAGDAFADNPMARMFREMMEPAQAAPDDPEPEEEAPEPDDPASAQNDPAALFGQMFEAGSEIQSGYQKSMERLFDEFAAHGRPVR